MKSVLALLTLVLLAGCGSSGSGGNSQPNKGNGGPTTGGVGQSKVTPEFVNSAWCNEYVVHGRTDQDRITFTREGVVTYTQYELQNGERKLQLGDTTGTWGMSGTAAQVAVGNFIFEMSYTEKDPTTKAPRLNLKIDGAWAAFEMCD